MTSQQSQSSDQKNTPYLSHNQQDLLLAALNSQAGGRQNTYPQAGVSGGLKHESPDEDTMNGAGGSTLFMSPQQAELDNFNVDYTPDVDYLDGDGFDFENADLGGEMIGALPGSGADLNDDSFEADQHEKRKATDDGSGSEEGDAKRQEGEKGAKKPGRKPLTSEPTTKRKAQNRAAQRAFRERKEKHLKDLETKVTELTKSQEADKHENGLLKAQVERLQVELREYRKRLSLNGGSGANRSPPVTAYSQSRNNTSPSYGSNFQFDFPKFGALPGSQIFGNQNYSNGSNPDLNNRTSATPPSTHSPINGSFSGPSQQNQFASRENSAARSVSPRSLSGTTTGSPTQIGNLNASVANFSSNDNMHGFASTLPQMGNNASDPFGDLFSPSILKSASVDGNSNYFPTPQNSGIGTINGLPDISGGDSTAGINSNRVFQFNSNSSTSDTASPSASSASQWNGNANSSCGTSPEPSHDSPANKPKNAETFCDKINPSNPANPNQPAVSSSLANGDYSIPSLDSFDPVLFGDYRESHDAIVGGGDFTGGFFDEALNPGPFDYSSPSNLFGILQSPQQSHASLGVPSSGAANAPTPSSNLMAEMDKARDGGDDDYGLPNSQQQQPKKLEGGKMISCNNIWNQLQSNPDFQEGKFDLDNLCSELRAKAKCSESGVMVDQEHVDAALRKLGKKDEKSGQMFEAPHHLMFEQESWDNVLKKLGNKSS